MASTMPIWLLIWVISDIMIFKMNAIQNSSQEINNTDNSGIETNSSFVDDESDELGIILNLFDPDDPSTNEESDSDSDSESKDQTEHTIHPNEQIKPTKPPFMQFQLKHPDKMKKGHNDSDITTTTPATTTISNSTGNSTITTKLIPPATIKSRIQHNNRKETQQKIIISSVPDCPPLDDADSISQSELIKRLVHVCRYDRLERPVSYDSKKQRQPVSVYARAYIYFIQNLDVHDLKFDIHLLFQLRYVDARLVFNEVSPSRKQPIVGRSIMGKSLWLPHIYMANARASNVLGTAEKDVLTSVSPDGTVIMSSRIQASLNCWMNLQMYPFDEQKCITIFESWMYNSSEVELHWEEASPITIAPGIRLTDYTFRSMWTNETIVHADLSNLRHGAFAGNYSSLSFTLHLSREMGCFIMDYFLPSILIVSLSWVSFWLRADAPQRVTLGTSTMLTFITLSSTHSRTLPKVSYIKMSEVWFVVCCLFIFTSLIEFAFVNTIYRLNNKVLLKKKKTIYILKSSLTPQAEHKDVSNGPTSANVSTSPTCSKRKSKKTTNNTNKTNEKQHLTVHYSNHESIPSITKTQYIDNLVQSNLIDVDPSLGANTNSDSIEGWTTMTSQEIAFWIDRRARMLFPFAFFIFNIVFWTVAYIS